MAEMQPIDVLRKLVTVGAGACNVDEQRALELLERLTGTTKPSKNKEFFYELCAVLKQGTQMKYSTERANKLRLRLKSFSKDDIMKAAKAIAADDFMMGGNGRKYGTIDYLLRKDEQIDTWLQTAEQKKQTAYSSAPTTPTSIEKAAEVKRADPKIVAEAKRKLYEKLGKV